MSSYELKLNSIKKIDRPSKKIYGEKKLRKLGLKERILESINLVILFVTRFYDKLNENTFICDTSKSHGCVVVRKKRSIFDQEQ